MFAEEYLGEDRYKQPLTQTHWKYLGELWRTDGAGVPWIRTGIFQRETLRMWNSPLFR